MDLRHRTEVGGAKQPPKSGEQWHSWNISEGVHKRNLEYGLALEFRMAEGGDSRPHNRYSDEAQWYRGAIPDSSLAARRGAEREDKKNPTHADVGGLVEEVRGDQEETIEREVV